MVAAQNMVQTLLGTDNSTKGKKVETIIHHTKQPRLTVNNICCCTFFTTLSVWADHFSLSVMCTPRNLKLHLLHYCPIDVDRGLLPMLFPEVHNHLLCLVTLSERLFS